jgi:hypothetical protein
MWASRKQRVPNVHWTMANIGDQVEEALEWGGTSSLLSGHNRQWREKWWIMRIMKSNLKFRQAESCTSPDPPHLKLIQLVFSTALDLFYMPLHMFYTIFYMPLYTFYTIFYVHYIRFTQSSTCIVYVLHNLLHAIVYILHNILHAFYTFYTISYMQCIRFTQSSTCTVYVLHNVLYVL